MSSSIQIKQGEIDFLYRMMTAFCGHEVRSGLIDAILGLLHGIGPSFA